MPVVLSGTNGVTFPDSSLQAAAASPYVLKNRIINGDMRIDQRNAGALINPIADGNFPLDRWRYFQSATSKLSGGQNAGAVTPPTGYTNYLGFTSLSAYSISSSDYFIVRQYIEGFNVADLAWGTANAQTVTLSFWVRSSLTGTFGGSLQNSAANRSYPFTYTISAANTWELKTITILGDTSGTWLTTNGVGITLNFGMGVGSTQSGTAGSWSGSGFLSATGATSVVGTNGATFYITGVQLEVGTSATPFERRLYNQELANCQRYYYKNSATSNQFGIGWNSTTTNANILTSFPVTMRVAPSALEQTGTAANYRIFHAATATTCSSVPTFNRGTDSNALTAFPVSSGLTAGQGSAGAAADGVTAYLAWSAEL